MKKVITSVYVWGVLALLAFTSPVKEKTTYAVDSQHSQINWKGAKVTGEHVGTLQLKEGSLQLEGEQLAGGSFTIDMSTIVTTDLSGEYKDQLEGHLKSDDFFGVANHPEATFVITKVAPQGGEQYEISGDLTIKGTTKTVTFPATVRVADGQVKADATLTVDRTLYNIRYGSGSFFDGLGDKLIYDEFELIVSLVAEQSAIGQ